MISLSNKNPVKHHISFCGRTSRTCLTRGRRPFWLLYSNGCALYFVQLRIAKVKRGQRFQRFSTCKDLTSFPDCGHKELKYEKWAPIMKPEFLSNESILDQIREKDRFIHVPYHSFNGYIRVLREAAIKPEVKAIKTTLYRLAKDSKVVKALITAARNGKKVTAVVELLARFDEESNIKWSKRMQEEGVNVIFGVEGLKIHSKLLYIESKKGNIACVGTGNFHEGNAKIYTDYLMMTARTKLVNEVAKVFDFIDRPFSPFRFNELLVSPNSMKSRILRMLDAEIKNANEGKEAWVKMKINHITDTDMFLAVEPFEYSNQKGLLPLVRQVREVLPQKDIWCFTGFLFDKDIIENMCKRWKETNELLSYIDVLVDGRFVEELKNLNLKFKGSENQRTILVNESLKSGNVILYDFDK